MKTIRIIQILLFAASLLLISFITASSNVHHLRSGDLIFCYGEGDEMELAISKATGEDMQKSYNHVGIILVEGDSTFVLEAVPKDGVCRTPIDIFLARANKDNGKPAVDVMRVNLDQASLDASIARAKTMLGSKYDFLYLPDNDNIYCSELVWMSYLDSSGKHVFDTVPMNFCAADGSMPQYWTDLFEAQGQSIPEGVPGTNPNSIAHSAIIHRLYNFRYE